MFPGGFALLAHISLRLRVLRLGCWLMAQVGNMLLLMLLSLMGTGIIVGNYIMPKQTVGGPAFVPVFTKPEDSYAHSRGPAPFSKFVEIAPLDTVVSQLAKRGFTLYLPMRIVKRMELTAVWAKVVDGQVSFPIIVLYSNTGDKDIAMAEIGIEIAPMPETPFSLVNSSTDRFDKVGGWTAFVSSRAQVGYREY